VTSCNVGEGGKGSIGRNRKKVLQGKIEKTPGGKKKRGDGEVLFWKKPGHQERRGDKRRKKAGIRLKRKGKKNTNKNMKTRM